MEFAVLCYESSIWDSYSVTRIEYLNTSIQLCVCIVVSKTREGERDREREWACY